MMTLMENELEAPVWPEWFDQGAAIEEYESTPPPTRKDEFWRFANISALDLSAFVPAAAVANEGRLIVASRGLDKSAAKMIFANNVLVHEDASRLPEGVIFSPLEVAAREHGDTLPEALLLPAGDVLARYAVHLETP